MVVRLPGSSGPLGSTMPDDQLQGLLRQLLGGGQVGGSDASAPAIIPENANGMSPIDTGGLNPTPFMPSRRMNDLPDRFNEPGFGGIDQGNVNMPAGVLDHALGNRKFASLDPAAGMTGEAGDGKMAALHYSIWDSTNKNITPKAQSYLTAVRKAAAEVGVTRVEFKAGAGPGHLSHAGGTEFDVIGYRADGSKWTNAQRVAVAQGARTAGANRFGVYPMKDTGSHDGQGVLHVGYSGPGRPAAVWGADGKVNGPESVAFRNPAEKAFSAAYHSNKPFDGATAVEHEGIVPKVEIAAAPVAAKSAALPLETPPKSADAGPRIQPRATDATAAGVLAPQPGAPSLVNNRLPATMAADAEDAVSGRAEAAQAIPAAEATAMANRDTLSVADRNAEPAGNVNASAAPPGAMAYGGGADQIAALQARMSGQPWESLDPASKQALSAKFGDRAQQVYEASRGALAQAGGGLGKAAPVQTAGITSPAAVGPRINKPAAPATGKGGYAVSARDRDIGIRTMLGEAGDPLGQSAVAQTIVNRAKAGYGGNKTIAGVALDPYQYSSWNHKDNGGNDLVRISAHDPRYKNAGKVFDDVIAGKIDPAANVGNAQYYHAGKNYGAPKGTRGVTIGGQTFFVPNGGTIPTISKASAKIAAATGMPQAAADRIGVPFKGTPPTLGIDSGNHDAVRFLQQKLRDAGGPAFDKLHVDGYYGPQTRDAVKGFSLHHGDPKPNGVAGPFVWKTLQGLAPEDGFAPSPPSPRLRPETGNGEPDMSAREKALETIGASSVARTEPPASMAPYTPPAPPRITARMGPDQLMQLGDRVTADRGAGATNLADKGGYDPPQSFTGFPELMQRNFVKDMTNLTNGRKAREAAQPASPGFFGPGGRLWNASGGLNTILHQLIHGSAPPAAAQPAPIAPAVSAPQLENAAIGSGAIRAQPGAVPGFSPAAATPPPAPQPATHSAQPAASSASGNPNGGGFGSGNTPFTIGGITYPDSFSAVKALDQIQSSDSSFYGGMPQ